MCVDYLAAPSLVARTCQLKALILGAIVLCFQSVEEMKKLWGETSAALCVGSVLFFIFFVIRIGSSLCSFVEHCPDWVSCHRRMSCSWVCTIGIEPLHSSPSPKQNKQFRQAV
jgi:hypothetical protein